MIITDCQFDCGGSNTETTVETGLKQWAKAGYSIPRIVYWDLSGYKNSPATVSSKNVGMVSGFSPSVLKAILGGEDFSPVAIMNKAIEKYKIVDPNDTKPVVKKTVADKSKPKKTKVVKAKISKKK